MEKQGVSSISDFMKVISQPARIRILLAIGHDEACVCHLEVMLGYRQAYISQHIMAMKAAGILSMRRSGRFRFYRLKNPEILNLIRSAARLAGLAQSDIAALFDMPPVTDCCCPKCQTNSEEALSLNIESIH